MSSFEEFKTSKMLSFTHSLGHIFLIQLQGIYFHLQSRKGRVTGKRAIREKGYSTKSATGGGTPPPLGYIILIPYTQKLTKPCIHFTPHRLSVSKWHLWFYGSFLKWFNKTAEKMLILHLAEICQWSLVPQGLCKLQSSSLCVRHLQQHPLQTSSAASRSM